jgi:putative transposase
MPRAARVVVEGVPHHITQRGNNRQDVFLVDEDRRYYLETLLDKCRQHGVTLLGYCLMTNHVHLIGVPRQPTSLALALGQAHWRYAVRFHRRYGRSGHLWQNRFYSCPLGPRHLVTALAYVDLNPLRAGLVGEPLQYPWSSAAAHATGSDPAGLIDEWEWTELGLQSDWKQRLESKMGEREEAELRQATYSGLPFGDRGFVAQLEQRLARRLRASPPGPTPKSHNAVAARS